MANATIPVIQINEGNVGIGTTTPLAKLDIQGTQGQLFSVTDNLSGSIFAVADISGVPIFDVNSSGVSYFDGNVGIGETTPNCKLDVKGVVNTTIIAATTLGDGGGAANRGLAIRTLTDGGEITTVGSSTNMYLDTANNLYLQNAGNTKVTMLANGNVGIGTTNPLHDLQIGTASTNGSYSMMIEGNFANTALSSNPRLNLIDTNFGITAGKYGSGASDDAIGIFAYQGAGRGILFAHTTAGSGTTLQNMRHDMFVDGGTGNVGIGTTNPEYGLSVLTDDGGGIGNIVAYDNAPNAAGVGGGIGFGGYYNATQITPWAIIRAPKDTGGNGNFAGALTFSTRNSTSFNEAMRISSAGAIKFNAYGAGTLVSDASGNITVSSGGGAGGPFLPLAGNTVATAMSGDINIGDNLGINWLSANNAFADITLGTDFRIYVGKSNADLIIENASNDLILKAAGDILIDDYIVHNGDTNSYFGFGAADEYKIILDNSTKIAADASSAYLYFEGNQMFKTYGDSGTTSGVSVPLGRLYSFDGDTDTGMFSDIANGVNFLCGNNETLRLTSTGATFSSGAGANGDCLVIIQADTNNAVENSNPILQLKQDGGSLGASFGLNGNANDSFTGAIANGGYVKTAEAFQIAPGNLLTTTFLNGGNVGIGTNAPLHALEIYGDAKNIAITNTTETDAGIVFRDAQAATDQAAAIKFGSGDNKLKFYVNDEVAQRMVIDTSGNVGINKTSPAVKLDVSDSIAGSGFTNGLARFENTIETSTGGAGVLNVANNYQGGFGTLIKFWFEESSVATINFNSSTNAVVYNTTSDYRLKEDLKSFNGLEIIDQIKTYNYKWKKADARGYGALAHELQEVFPDAVTGEKDGEDMQGVDYSTLVPVLIKSIQELKAEIELLKQQINN